MPELPRPEPDADAIHVLVVDDEPVLVEEIVEFLAGEGIATSAAGSAPAAVRQIEQAMPGAFSVVLTDVRMPGRDGLSLSRAIIGAGGEANAVEVVVMTGHGDMGMAIEALRSRVFDFIRKPLRLSLLAESLRAAHAAAMARRRCHRDSAAALARLHAEARVLAARIGGLSASVAGRDERSGAAFPGPAFPGAAFPGPAFLGIVGDALRPPLAPIGSLADLIAEAGAELPSWQLAAFATLIRQAGEQLTGLIDTMLNVAALESGARHCRPLPLHAGEIVAELAGLHGAQARACGQTIDAPAPPDIVLTTDRRYLLMALRQLVGNAIQFGPPAQTVRIEAAAAGGEVAFRVIDSGPGMTGAQLAQLRRPFRRSGLSPARRNGGLGLGLSLAERAAVALGGRLELTSAPGSGTMAAVVLPAAAACPG